VSLSPRLPCRTPHPADFRFAIIADTHIIDEFHQGPKATFSSAAFGSITSTFPARRASRDDLE